MRQSMFSRSRVARLCYLVAALIGSAGALRSAQAQRFEISISGATRPQPTTGRLVLVVSKRESPEPRLLIGPQGPALFAVDLDQQRAGDAAIIDARAIGYPMSLATLPPGDYFVQAVVNVYERAARADGHTVWVHLNDGRQEFFSDAAGNLYSAVQRVHIDAKSVARLTIDKVMPAPPKPQDTEYVKHATIKSELLTKWWGRAIFIHATVLLPRGFASHPSVRYPAIYTFGHSIPFGFTMDSSQARGRGQINPVTGLESGYDFAQAWLGDSMPRVVAIALEQRTPYFPDSYSVNSANNGPYGDAVIQEIIPELERRFRLVPNEYARIVEGASTGGWQSLALQLYHPEFFGGAWVLQPDPIDFRSYQLANIYEDTSAFVMPAGQFVNAERPFRRIVDGQNVWSVRELSLFEEVLGTRGRSGYQLEAWEAIFGPTDADGYPKPLWDKRTGHIDRDVANYWRDHGYDLRDYMQRNWSSLGPKLAGKLHFFAGDMDDFFLNLAVYRVEDFLNSASSPASDATFTYGRPKKGHGWHAATWSDVVRQMGAHIKRRAPAGEPTEAWWY